MKHKTAELEGELLDAAVAKAEGVKPGSGIRSPFPHWEFPDGRTVLVSKYRPSEEWWQGGPIIEREQIHVHPHDQSPPWRAYVFAEKGINVGAGPTPLIAAMRAFVASKLGEEVEL